MNSPSWWCRSQVALSEKSASLDERVVQDTRRWLEKAVIGLNLCPFAKAAHVNERIHYAVSRETSTKRLLERVALEIEALQQHSASERETTLLMAPCCLHDFFDFNDFMGTADRLLARAGLEGVIQLASFHPAYQFADATPDDIGNCSNRSPYPTVHLLREASIDGALAAFPRPERIYEANLATLARLGPEGWAALGVGPTA